MWSFTEEEVKAYPPNLRFSKSVANAQQGLQLLADAGISATAINSDGWEFLHGLTERQPLLTRQLQARRQADAAIEEFLATFEKEPARGEKPASNEEKESGPDEVLL